MLNKITIVVLLGSFISANSDCNSLSPVCGQNNVTYQNSCRCQQANVSVAYQGQCRNSSAQNQGGLTAYTMRDSSLRTPTKASAQYLFSTQHDAVPKGPFLPDTAGALKVTGEFSSGEWQWEHGVHQALSNLDYSQKPAMDPFEWINQRTNQWDSVRENYTISDSQQQSEKPQNWDHIEDDEWAQKMEWTEDNNGLIQGQLTVEESKPLEGVAVSETWDLSNDMNGMSWLNGSQIDAQENVGASLVGSSRS